MRSFTRQLNQYSFWKGRSVSFNEGEDNAATMYNHPNFQRGRPELLAHITRRPIGEAPAPPPVKQSYGRLKGLSHRHFNAGVDCIGMQRGIKRTRLSDIACKKMGEYHALSNAHALDSTGLDDNMEWAAPHKVSKAKSPHQRVSTSKCNLHDTPTQRVGNLACWFEAIADPEWAAFSNGNGGSLRTLDEGRGQENTDSVTAMAEHEDQTMAEMSKTVTKFDVTYVVLLRNTLCVRHLEFLGRSLCVFCVYC